MRSHTQWTTIGDCKVSECLGGISIIHNGSQHIFRISRKRAALIKRIAVEQKVIDFSLQLQEIQENLTKKKIDSTIYEIGGFSLDKFSILNQVIMGYFSSYQDVRRVKVTPRISEFMFLVQFWWNPDTDPEIITGIEAKLSDLAKQYDLSIDKEEIGIL